MATVWVAKFGYCRRLETGGINSPRWKARPDGEEVRAVPPTLDHPPESSSRTHLALTTRQAFEVIEDACRDGVPIVPLIGAGLSAESGVPTTPVLIDYFAKVRALIELRLAPGVAGSTRGRPRCGGLSTMAPRARSTATTCSRPAGPTSRRSMTS